MWHTFKEPTAIEFWIKTFPFMADVEWSKLFLLPYSFIKQPYFQSLQYKILNNILNCNQQLKKWKIKESEQCIYCSEVDTLIHHLYDCVESKKIWKNLEIWMKNNLKLTFKLTICEVIFGIPIIVYKNMNVLNFLILITKYYINKNRTGNRPLFFFELLQTIKNLCFINKEISLRNAQEMDACTQILCDTV